MNYDFSLHQVILGGDFEGLESHVEIVGGKCTTCKKRVWLKDAMTHDCEVVAIAKSVKARAKRVKGGVK